MEEENMLLQELNRKEKLKFLDLALHMIVADGPINDIEKKLLDTFIAEIGDDITDEYSFTLSSDLDITLQYLSEKPIKIRNIIFLNLLHLTLFEDFYTISEHFLLENIQRQIGVSDDTKKKLMRLIYDQEAIIAKITNVVNEPK